jgi:NitT/TauT family transport system permease protein
MSAVPTQTAARLEATDEDPVFAVDPSIRVRRRQMLIVRAARLTLGAALIAFWYLASGHLISAFWISNPTDVISALGRLWREQSLGNAIVATVTETLVGFGVATVVAIAMGITLGMNRTICRILDPYIVAVASVPRIALIPLLILWCGVGFTTKIVFTALLVFFPVFMNTLAGIRSADRELIEVISVMGASRLDAIRKVLIPSALVWVFAGLRISVPFALIGAVVAEMFTSNQGLGYLISRSANQFDTAANIAAVLVTTALGLVLLALINVLERRLLRWRPVES